MSELELLVSGMTCEHCERAVAAELSAVAGVEDLDVDAETGRVLLTHSAPLDRAAVERAIVDAGYGLTQWSSEDHG